MADMTRLLLLLLAVVSVSSAVSLEKRIIRGGTCEDKERHYHVMLVDAKGDFICGGSLIDKQWILTAAHCWEDGLKAVLNVHGGPGPKTSLEITATPVVYEDDQKRDHDIMLLKLPKYKAKVTTISLPACGSDKPELTNEVQIAGHAANAPQTGTIDLRDPNSESATLRCAMIPLVDCASIRQNDYEKILCGESPKTQTPPTPRVDACFGDSGGGVVYKDKIYGVISFTGDPVKVCSKPVGFMDVCEYKKWIKDTTAGHLKKCLGRMSGIFNCG